MFYATARNLVEFLVTKPLDKEDPKNGQTNATIMLDPNQIFSTFNVQSIYLKIEIELRNI